MSFFLSVFVLWLAFITLYDSPLSAALRDEPDMAASSHPLPSWEGRLKNWKERLDKRGALDIDETRAILQKLETAFEHLQAEEKSLLHTLRPSDQASPRLKKTNWSCSLSPNPDMRGQFSLYRKISSVFYLLARNIDQLRQSLSLQSVAPEPPFVPSSSPLLPHKKSSRLKWPKDASSSTKNHRHRPFK